MLLQCPLIDGGSITRLTVLDHFAQRLLRRCSLSSAPNGSVALAWLVAFGLAGSLVGALRGLATGSVAIGSAKWLDD